METVASRKQSSDMEQQFSDLRHEWKSMKQYGRLSNPRSVRNSLMDSRGCELGVDEFQGRRKLFKERGSDEELGGCRVSSLSSCYSSEVYDDEVSSGVEGDDLEQRLIDLQQEWNSVKNSIRHRFPTRRRISAPDEFHGRRLFDDSDEESNKYHHGRAVPSTSSRVSDLGDRDGEVEASSGFSNLQINDGCGVMSSGRWRVLIVACLAISLMMFTVGLTCSVHPRQPSNIHFLVPT